MADGITGFRLLMKNLIDNVKEQQAKLGYRKEVVYFYYPLSSLRHFFNENCSEKEMLDMLRNFPEEITNRLGSINVSNDKDRFCFEISETGSEYVHQNVRDNEFINALIKLISQHGCNIEKIVNLFKSYSDNIEVCEIHNGEFDYRISFLNNEEDQYYYCFHDEGSHIIYHRFLPDDYYDFGFEL